MLQHQRTCVEFRWVQFYHSDFRPSMFYLFLAMYPLLYMYYVRHWHLFVVWFESTTFKKCYMNKVYYNVQIVYHATVYDCFNRDIRSFIYFEGKIIFGVHKRITQKYRRVTETAKLQCDWQTDQVSDSTEKLSIHIMLKIWSKFNRTVCKNSLVKKHNLEC